MSNMSRALAKRRKGPTPIEDTVKILDYIVLHSWCDVQTLAIMMGWPMNRMYVKLKRLHEDFGWLRRGPSSRNQNVLVYNITRKGLALREAYAKE